MEWPELDMSPIQKWLMHVVVDAQTTGSPPQKPPQGLHPIIFDVIILWNPATTDFFMELPSVQ